MTLKSLLNQFQRWLMQPHVWRFVCFSSTVVALLCYALSSSFNHLFGGWNLWKICVYSVLSFIICFAVLFAKEWQPSNSNRFEAHMASLVLTVTSVYSFFYDKMVNEKPDAYSLISCAAFAVMSLGLSKQTHFGVEVDLLYFFLAALIVQLMKIKLLLGIVGACFGCSLIFLRSSLNEPLESGYRETQDPHDVAVPTDIADIRPKLKACMEALMENKRVVIDMLLRRVQEYMEEYDDPNDKDHIPVDNNLVIDALQSDIVNKLSDAVKLMVAAGFETDCCLEYISCRREFLREILSDCRRLRRGWMSRKRLKTPDFWNTLLGKTLANFNTNLGFGSQELDVEDVPEDRIVIWVETFHIAMMILFPNERRLCERVFSGFTSATDLAFIEVCQELTIELLDFANSFVARNELPLVWIEIPKVVKTLLGLIPEFQSLFFELTNDQLRNKVINTCEKLEEATKGIFTEIENWICHDKAMADFSVWIYPISRDAMDYLGGVSKSRISLEKVFQENSFVAHWQGTSSSLGTQTAEIMEKLDRQLEVKSKNDADPALYYFSLMNNRRYIEQSVKGSIELGKILGDDWIQNHSANVQQSLEDYQRSSWDEVLGHLKLDGNEPITAKSMIKNLKLFNMQLKKIYRTQSTWYAPDEVLREKIRGSLKNIVLPAYGKFIDRLQTILGRQSDGHIRFSMDDINDLLNDLFRGSLTEDQSDGYIRFSMDDDIDYLLNGLSRGSLTEDQSDDDIDYLLNDVSWITDSLTEDQSDGYIRFSMDDDIDYLLNDLFRGSLTEDQLLEKKVLGLAQFKSKLG